MPSCFLVCTVSSASFSSSYVHLERSRRDNLLTYFPAGFVMISYRKYLCLCLFSRKQLCISLVYKSKENASPLRLFDVKAPVHRALLKLQVYIYIYIYIYLTIGNLICVGHFTAGCVMNRKSSR